MMLDKEFRDDFKDAVDDLLKCFEYCGDEAYSENMFIRLMIGLDKIGFLPPDDEVDDE